MSNYRQSGDQYEAPERISHRVAYYGECNSNLKWQGEVQDSVLRGKMVRLRKPISVEL